MKNKIERYAITTQHRDDLYTKSYGCYVTVMQYFLLKIYEGVVK